MSPAERGRGGRSPLRSLFAVLVLGIGLSVLGASSASAHTDEPVNTTGEVLSPSILPVEAEYLNRGGWSGGNKFVTNPATIIGTPDVSRTQMSETYAISEPYRKAGTGLQVEFKYTGSRVDTDGNGGISPVRWFAVESVFYCKAPTSSSVTTTYWGHVQYNAGSTGFTVGLTGSTQDGCALGTELVAIEFYAHTYIVPASGVPFLYSNGTTSLQAKSPSLANPRYKTPESCYLDCTWEVRETMRTVWYPGLDIDYTPFDNMLPDYDDGNAGAICVVNPKAVQCDIVNRWKPYEDATSFDKVCAGAPSAEWSSWGWLPEWVGHYALCLFRPAAGFPVDPVKWSVENSSVGDVFATGSALAASLPKAETCGQLISTTIGGSPFVMDSCTWEEWSQAKTYIGIAAMIFAGIAGFNLIVSAFTSRDMRWDSGGDS